MEKIKIDNIEVAYDDQGQSDRVIVLMHGWGCSSATLRSIAAVALSAGYRVVNIDFPGFGYSTEPTVTWGVDEYTTVVERLVDSLGIKSPVLLGHSFGGRVGILYASRNPVDKLILVDAAGVKPRRSLKYHLKVAWFKTCKAFVKAFLSKEKAEKVIEEMRGKKGSSDYAAASPRMRMILSKVVNEDLCHVMPLIKAPTLLIWGSNDTATPISDARKMERLIPDAGLVNFEGCGHYSFLDNPAGFSRVLTNFLNS